MSCLSQWVELVCTCCSEEQPVEVKLMAAKVLVNCTGTLLASPRLPLGESQWWNISAKCLPPMLLTLWDNDISSQPVKVPFNGKDLELGLGSPIIVVTLILSRVCVCVSGLSTTLSLWRSLFGLLQDEDQDVRDFASDFISNVPAALLRKGTHSLPRWGMSAHTCSKSCINLLSQSKCCILCSVLIYTHDIYTRETNTERLAYMHTLSLTNPC